MAARRADTPPPTLRLVREGEDVAAQEPEPITENFCFGRKGETTIRVKVARQFVIPRAVPFLTRAPTRKARARKDGCAATAPTPPTKDQPRRRPPRQQDLIERHRHLEVYGSRPRSLRRQSLTRKERAQLKVDHRYLQRQGVYAGRARTWGECQERNPAGPCGWVSCSMNLFLEVDEDGIIKENFPGRQVWELEETCALRIAAEGEHTLERVGELVNVVLERARQLQDAALEKLEKFARTARGDDTED